MRMDNQAVLRRMARDNMDKMKDTEFFCSDAFCNFLQTIVNGITKRFKRPAKVIIHSDEKSGETAATNNKVVMVNVSGPELPGLSRSERFSVIKGLVTHECGHILFTDFKLIAKASEIRKTEKKLYPEPSCTTEYKNWEALVQASNRPTQDVLFAIFDQLFNCIEDGNIEKQVCSVYLGAAKDLRFMGKVYQSALPDISEYDSISAILNASNQIAVYGGKVKGTHTDEEVNDTIEKMRPYIRAAVNEDNAETRLRLINEAYVIFINECIELLRQDDSEPSDGDEDEREEQTKEKSGSDNDQKASGQGNGESKGQNSQQGQQPNGKEETGASDNNGNGQASLDPKTAEAMANRIVQVLGQNGQIQTGNHAAAPKGVTASVKNSKITANGSDSGNLSGNETQDNSEEEKELQQVLSTAAMEQAKDQFESQLATRLAAEGSECKQSRLSEYPMHMERESGDQDQKSEKVLREMDEAVKPYSKRIQRDLQRILTDMQQGDIKRGLFMGRKFDSSRAYRQDGRKMASRKAPTDAPDLAVMVLVDESGSMYGGKIQSAMLASYLVYDFCTGMGIPVSIYGHNEDRLDGHVNLYSLAEFDSVDGKDKYRIAKMDCANCNRDGYAIRFASQHLLKRPEEMKLLIIISDGAPNGNNYSGDKAAKDIRDAVEEAKKAGITEVFTAGIGESRNEIREVYEDPARASKCAKFLNISDLSKMPRIFVELVREAMDIG